MIFQVLLTTSVVYIGQPVRCPAHASQCPDSNTGMKCYSTCWFILAISRSSLNWLHFGWVTDDTKCIVVTRVCVYVWICVCPRPHAYTIACTRM